MAAVAPLNVAQQFTIVATSNPNVLKCIVDRLSKRDAGSLREVNNAIRFAVNRTVSALYYTLDSPHIQHELEQVFPEADRLVCDLEGSTAGATPPIEHVELLLDCLATSSPGFIGKLRALTLMVRDSHLGQFHGIMDDFLPRCTGLLSLEVKHGSGRQLFQGQGSSPAEQRSSMQRQLAAMCNSSDILAAPSWPACGCLTSLVQSAGMHASFVTAALHTTSLVDLQIVVSAAYPAASMPAFQQLSSLTRLTHLTFFVCDRPADELQRMLWASAQISSLRQLQVVAVCSEPAVVASLPLSNLPRLTQLEVRGLRMDLASLSGAPALSCLDMLQCTGLGSLTSLLRLTSLTKLVGPEGLGPRPLDPAAAPTAAPAAWRQGLQSLRWPGFQADSWPRVVQQLSSLTQLCMTGVCVSPGFCRMLAKLPRLAELGLVRASAPHPFPPAPPMHVRPTLPALTRVFVSDGGMAALHMLARWTRVAEAGVQLAAEGVFLTCTVAVKGWSVGWLRASLAQFWELCDDGAMEHPAGFALADDADIAAVAAAIGGPSALSWLVYLGKDVTPQGCARMPVGEAIVVNELAAEDVLPHVVGWTAPLVPSAEHLLALARPCLTALSVDDAALLGDDAVGALVGRVTALESLGLYNAARVTDVALWEVCAGCRQLERLMLRGAGKVTAAGLLPLLTTHRRLRYLGLERGAGQEWADLPVLLSSLEAAFPGMHQAWQVEQDPSTGYDLVFKRTGADE